MRRRSVMIRVLHVSLAFLALIGQALAQAPSGGPGRGPFAPIVIGPSAPVPPEVAIPRPTPAELTQINDAMTKWIASDNSPARPLLQEYESLLMLQAPRMNVAATYTQTQQRI